MPELPEVETVLRTLEKQIPDRRIDLVTVRFARTIEGDADEFAQKLQGQHFRSFVRRGKYLLFYLDDILLSVHLRMEGKFWLQNPDEPLDRHMHVLFDLDDGRQLRFHDTRKFGRMELLPYDTDLGHFHDLGPEPFDEAFSPAYVHSCIRRKHVPLKSLLLDQHFVAGIGNIYADEILAACGLRPGRSCQRITKQNEEQIVSETRRILKAAIAAGGTTIRSYTSSLGITGLFQTECTVHTMKTCGRCGSEIRMKRIGGRSSYYCPHCQK